MSGNLNLQFLWENFRIERGKAIRKELKNSQDKVEVAFNKELADIFSYRLSRDPGFAWEVRKRVAKDPDLPALMEKYVLSLMIQDEDTLRKKIFSITKNYEKSVRLPFKSDQTNPSIDIDKDISNPINSSSTIQGKKEYFEKRYEAALSKEDYDEIASIQFHVKIFDIVKQEGMRNSKEHFRLATESFYTGLPDFKEIHNKANRKILENIIVANQFFENNKHSDHLVVEVVPYNVEFVLSMLHLLYFICEDQSSEDIDAFKREWRLIKTLTLIQEELWFDKLSEDEKIALLNSFFDFEITPELLDGWKKWEDVPGSFYLYELTDIAKYLALNRYFEESKVLNHFILDNTEDNRLKFICTDGLALCERELNNLEAALSLFESTLALLKNGFYKSLKHDITFYEAESLIAIGQLIYVIHSKEKSSSYFNKVKALMKGFSDEEKAILWKQISYTYILNERYLKEKKFVQLESSQKITNKRRLVKAQNEKRKSKLITDSLIIPGVFTLKLEVAEYEIDYGLRSAIRAESAFNSFQYSKAIQWYTKAYNRSLVDPQALKRAYCYFFQQRFDEALKELNRLDKLVLPFGFRSECSALSMSIFIRLNQFDEAFLYLKKCVESGLTDIEKQILAGSKKTEPQKSLDLCLKNLIYLVDNDRLISFFDNLINTYENNPSRSFVSDLIGLAFSESYGAPEALRYFDRAIEENPHNTRLLARILNNKACIFYDQGKYGKAIKYYKKSLFIYSSDPTTNCSLASAYHNVGDNCTASLYIKKAIEVNPHEPIYFAFLDIYETFQRDSITTTEKLDDDVKKLWQAADYTFFNQKAPKELEKHLFNSAIANYCIGLEMLLHKEISKEICKRIIKKSKQTKDYPGWLPGTLFTLYKNDCEKTITLGQWQYIINDLRSENGNKLVQATSEYLHNRFNGKFPIIIEACKSINKHRTKAIHPQKITWNKMIEIREKIVQNLNLVIDALYSDEILE